MTAYEAFSDWHDRHEPVTVDRLERLMGWCVGQDDWRAERAAVCMGWYLRERWDEWLKQTNERRAV